MTALIKIKGINDAKEELNDFSIYEPNMICETLKNWWLTDELNINMTKDKVYIRKVGNHLEIGKVNIEIEA